MVTSYQSTGLRYISLRIISTFFALVATLLLLVACYALYLAFTTQAGARPPQPGNQNLVDIANALQFQAMPLKTSRFITSAGFFIASVLWFAWSSIIRLMIHVEENTRATAQFLEQLTSTARRQ